MKKGIAFFDFDGTITTHDTLLEFIRFCKGTAAYYMGFLINSPYLVMMKLGIMSNQAAKEKVLRHFFKGTPLQKFREDCERFSRERLPALIRPGAVTEIADLKNSGYAVVIVSASPELWICHWAEEQDVALMGSQLEVKDGMITGKITGKNCHGDEKVRRIREKYSIDDYEIVHAYGDTSGDLPMLELASKKFYRPFRN